MRDRIFTPIFSVFAGFSSNEEAMNIYEGFVRLKTSNFGTTVFHPEYAVSNSREIIICRGGSICINHAEYTQRQHGLQKTIKQSISDGKVLLLSVFPILLLQFGVVGERTYGDKREI